MTCAYNNKHTTKYICTNVISILVCETDKKLVQTGGKAMGLIAIIHMIDVDYTEFRRSRYFV